MKSEKFIVAICLLAMLLIGGNLCAQRDKNRMNEQYRPQIHFTPEAHWMNDPNGMVYYKGAYHLFFQYHPYSAVWGPMHWGHATSTDLIRWKQQPIALYPDSLGTIFSGSAVVDKNNTSGFGKNGQPPLVAIFTQHDSIGEKAGRNNFQNQSIAYSNDAGKTWVKYARNPVLKNPGITDFRDPKVSWFEAGKKWVMTLATKDHITFYSSKNLKQWTKESEFGSAIGAHGGVWECPDLFSLDYQGKKVWVLLISINPGGPNGGSSTQYFTGDFDGNTFKPFQTDTRWLDYGKDNYAGITWSNTGSRKIFIGWMSNWQYANLVPTATWRSACTVPRELAIQKTGGKYYVASTPVKELGLIDDKTKVAENINGANYDLKKMIGTFDGTAKIDINVDKLKTFSFTLSNGLGEKISLGYNGDSNQYFIDRTKSGKSDFQKDFAGVHTAPRLSGNAGTNITLIIDRASVELFADDGLTVMTDIFFPDKPFDQMHLQSPDHILIKKITFTGLKSIWRGQ